MTRFRDGSRLCHLAFIMGLACMKAVITLSFVYIRSPQLCTYLDGLYSRKTTGRLLANVCERTKSIFAICGHVKTLTQTNSNFIFHCQEPSGKKEKQNKTHNKPASAYLQGPGSVRETDRDTWSRCCPRRPHISRTQPSTRLQLIRLFYLLSTFFHQRIHPLKSWQKSVESTDCM